MHSVDEFPLAVGNPCGRVVAHTDDISTAKNPGSPASVKPDGVGQNIALHASYAAKSSAVPSSTFEVH